MKHTLFAVVVALLFVPRCAHAYTFGDGCSTGNIQICGTIFQPASGTIGNIQTFTLPDRFQLRTAAVQCVSEGGTPYYKLTDGAVATCALRNCTASEVRLCDKKIPVTLTTAVGETTRVAVPSDFLADGDLYALSFTARCSINSGSPQYEIADASSVSCNSFLCKPTSLPICNTSITINQSAKLGEVVRTTTATNQAITVQCLGSGDHAPRYIVTEHDCY